MSEAAPGRPEPTADPARSPGTVAAVRAAVGLGLGLGTGTLLGAMVLADPGAPPWTVVGLAVLLAAVVAAIPSGVSGWAEVRLGRRPALAGLVTWLAWVGALGAGAVQLVYLRAAFVGGPDAGLEAIQRLATGLTVADVHGLGFVTGLVGAAVLPCALMVRARASGRAAPPITGLALEAVSGSALTLALALVTALGSAGSGVGGPNDPPSPVWGLLFGGAFGAVAVLLFTGWALLPAWAATFRLADRAEAWWRTRRTDER